MSARTESVRARGRIRNGGATHLLSPSSIVTGSYWTLCGWYGRLGSNLTLTEEPATCKTCLRSPRAGCVAPPAVEADPPQQENLKRPTGRTCGDEKA